MTGEYNLREVVTALVIGLVGAALMLLAMYLTAESLLSTGPGCPGMDPSYMGWCE